MLDMMPYRKPARKDAAQMLARRRARCWPIFWAFALLAIAVLVMVGAFFGIGAAVVVFFLCLAAGLVVLVGFGLPHMMTKEEIERAKADLPGHDIFKPGEALITAGKSYDLDCAPEDLWPYLAQMNLTKAGFYSFQVLERLAGFHIRNDYTIRPEWQRIEPGDFLYYHQNGFGTGVVDVKENEYLLTYSDTRYQPTQPLALAWHPKWMEGFAWTWNFILEPSHDPDGKEGTRFLTYLQVWWPEATGKPTILRLLVQWGLPSIFMVNGMARKLRKLAETDARARRTGMPRPGYNYTK